MQYIGDTLRMTVLGAAVALIYMLSRRSDAATNAMHETKVAQQALAKQTLEARLQLMEAQIEPHFLFNSLANVQRLYETQPQFGEHTRAPRRAIRRSSRVVPVRERALGCRRSDRGTHPIAHVRGRRIHFRHAHAKPRSRVERPRGGARPASLA